jgi:diguanylate cyclase (GGDEF)-like protein
MIVAGSLVKRDELQPIGGVLSLIRDLSGEPMRAASVPELFQASFGALGDCVPFAVAAAVMIEQNLDLHVVTCNGAAIGDAVMERIRARLQAMIPISAEIVVASESLLGGGQALLPVPPHEGTGKSACPPHDIAAILQIENRTAGLLLLLRDAPFDETDAQLLEIFAAQVAMLLGHLSAREQIQNLADTDDLTGIWNKRYFRRQLPQEIERARVYSLPLSLLMFDVDDFKEINDSLGHTIGDVVLSELCGAVRDSLRPPDLFARFGGDEFAVILPHTDRGGACAVANRILRNVRELTIPTDEEGSVRCSISIGVAHYESGDGATDLIRRADERLYESKRSGKNRYTA